MAGDEVDAPKGQALTKVDLSGARLKLGRADAHIRALQSATDSFLDSDPKPIRVEFAHTTAANGSRHYVGRAVISRLPPPEWALIVGDAVQNMRAALDYLLWEMLQPPLRARERSHSFPISSSEANFARYGWLNDLHPDHRQLIESVQPYRKSAPREDPLFILRELSNQDKHRLLLALAVARDDFGAWVGSSHADFGESWRIRNGPLEDGADVIAFTARPTQAVEDMVIDPHAALAIALASFPGIDAVRLLDMIHFHIARLVEMYFAHGMVPSPHY